MHGIAQANIDRFHLLLETETDPTVGGIGRFARIDCFDRTLSAVSVAS
jgi:hypothetical protein